MRGISPAEGVIPELKHVHSAAGHQGRFMKGDKMRVDAIKYDITKLENCAAVVNSTNYFLSDGAPKSVNHAIHLAAGPRLHEVCRRLGTCNTGEAITTDAFDMKADYIIHTVTPSWRADKSDKANKLLTKCYTNCLKAALDKGARSIAFPSLGTGHCHFPPEMAAETAVTAVKEFLDENPGSFDAITWSLSSQEMADIYRSVIARKIPGAFVVKEPKQEAAPEDISIEKQDIPAEDKIVKFCLKYYLVLKLIDKDQLLKDWCREYNAQAMSQSHSALKDILQFRMPSDAYRAGIMTGKAQEILEDEGVEYENLKTLNNDDMSKLDPAVLKAALELQFKADEANEGVLIREGVASGFVVKLVRALYNMLR